MESGTIATSLIELRKEVSSIRADIGNYIQPKIGAILNEMPSPFGCTRWQANSGENKRVVLDLYATGKIVYNLQDRITNTDKDPIQTSGYFPTPNMEPQIGSNCNYFDLWIDGQLDELVQKIKEHFEAEAV